MSSFTITFPSSERGYEISQFAKKLGESSIRLLIETIYDAVGNNKIEGNDIFLKLFEKQIEDRVKEKHENAKNEAVQVVKDEMYELRSASIKLQSDYEHLSLTHNLLTQQFEMDIEARVKYEVAKNNNSLREENNRKTLELSQLSHKYEIDLKTINNNLVTRKIDSEIMPRFEALDQKLQIFERDDKSAFQLGKDGEKLTKTLLEQFLPDDCDIQDVNSEGHSTDMIVIQGKKKTLIEVKNYKSKIPSKQVEKMWVDVRTKQCCGLFISLNTGIVGHVNGSIDIVDNKYPILYLSNFKDNLERINDFYEIIKHLDSVITNDGTISFKDDELARIETKLDKIMTNMKTIEKLAKESYNECMKEILDMISEKKGSTKKLRVKAKK